MFNLVIEKYFDNQKKSIYEFRYELVPEHDFKNRRTIVHRCQFSSEKTAHKFKLNLDEFLTDCYFFLENIHYRLNGLSDFSENYSATKITARNAADVCRSEILLTCTKKNFVKTYEVTAKLKSYIAALKIYCTALGCDSPVVKRSFYQLEQFREYFINTYRSALLLHEKNMLRLFSF
ncbi:hypothetical protein AAH994_06040 [Weeksellaceae bacterium A-14]